MNTGLQNQHLIDHKLSSYFEKLAYYNSTQALQKSLVFQSLKKEFNRLIQDIEYGFYAHDNLGIKKPFYRAIYWNIDHGISFEPVLAALSQHNDLSKADFLYLTQTDIGLKRTRNRNIARDLAMALGMNYFFAPSYINLCERENGLGLQGNALLSRYPLRQMRSFAFKNCRDKMGGREKLFGGQQALIAEIALPHQTITAVVAPLESFCSHRQRARQITHLLDNLKNNPYPVLLGGDLNSEMKKSLWDKFISSKNLLFNILNEQGFNYELFNESGEDKPDWFAGRGLKLADLELKGSSPPKVIPTLKHMGVPLTDHDPILVDFDPY